MYVIVLAFTEQRSRAPEWLEGHKQWLARGFSDGVFLLAGSLADERGGLVLAHACSRAELERRVGADPFVEKGVVSVEVLELSPKRVDPRLSFLLD